MWPIGQSQAGASIVAASCLAEACDAAQRVDAIVSSYCESLVAYYKLVYLYYLVVVTTSE